MLMITRYKHKNLHWIDIDSPSADEIRKISDEFGIHPVVSNELLSPTLKPRVDLYENYIYLILHFPSFHGALGERKINEVDFIIGRDFILTTHYEEIDALHKFSKIFEVNSILDKSDIGKHAGFVFFYMVREAYQSLLNELEAVKDSLERIQERVFRGKEKEMVRELSYASRNLLDFTRATKLHKEVLHSFQVAGEKFFGADFTYHLRSILGEYYKVDDAISGNRAFLEELRQTNNSLLSTKQNEIMKVLTIMAFITFPLSLIAGIFGMNTDNLPIVGHPQDFWIVVGLMAILTAIFFWFFKHKKWL
ncbi:MAG: magnesium transporter CorA family protein [bacterium]|nr:magnesium transporter CorA family protein [bacterium]